MTVKGTDVDRSCVIQFGAECFDDQTQRYRDGAKVQVVRGSDVAVVRLLYGKAVGAVCALGHLSSAKPTYY